MAKEITFMDGLKQVMSFIRQFDRYKRNVKSMYQIAEVIIPKKAKEISLKEKKHEVVIESNKAEMLQSALVHMGFKAAAVKKTILLMGSDVEKLSMEDSIRKALTLMNSLKKDVVNQ